MPDDNTPEDDALDDDTPKERELIRQARTLTAEERGLLREARRFLRAKVRELEAMLPASVELRGRLAQTRAFKLVDGKDVAERTPIWDLWATLDICFERYLREGVEILAGCIEDPEVRHRRRK